MIAKQRLSFMQDVGLPTNHSRPSVKRGNKCLSNPLTSDDTRSSSSVHLPDLSENCTATSLFLVTVLFKTLFISLHDLLGM